MLKSQEVKVPKRVSSLSLQNVPKRVSSLQKPRNLCRFSCCIDNVRNEANAVYVEY